MKTGRPKGLFRKIINTYDGRMFTCIKCGVEFWGRLGSKYCLDCKVTVFRERKTKKKVIDL
jgi:hypothetical protein